MTGSRRGRMLLLAQLPGPPLGSPPAWLHPEAVRAWYDVVSAAPDVLRDVDSPHVALTATVVERWRSGDRDPVLLRLAYRALGDCFLSMPERRRLLFPDRPSRQHSR